MQVVVITLAAGDEVRGKAGAIGDLFGGE